MKTVVIGATTNPERYAYLAVKRLLKFGHEVVPVGKNEGEIDGIKIHTDRPDVKDVHTVTLYLNPMHQKEVYDYILSLHPKRIIFNPGAENPEFETIAKKNGIEVTEACTLVLLSTGMYETAEKQ